MGRFVQEDPIGHAGGGNLYAYAGGNPLEARDPSGMMANHELMFSPKINHSCGPALYLDGAAVSCSGGGGGGGALTGTLLEILQRQVQRDYAVYLRAYFAARSAAIETARSGNLTDLATKLERYSRPLTRDGFFAVRSAIDQLAECPGCRAKEAQLLSAMLSDGRIFDNSVLVGAGNSAMSIISVAPALNLIMLGPSAYNQTATGLSFILSHEAWHHFMPGEQDEEAINGYACASVPAAAQCRMLRAWGVIP